MGEEKEAGNNHVKADFEKTICGILSQPRAQHYEIK
jgi:hypothetical protein